jgi:hypothetical protein
MPRQKEVLLRKINKNKEDREQSKTDISTSIVHCTL